MTVRHDHSRPHLRRTVFRMALPTMAAWSLLSSCATRPPAPQAPTPAPQVNSGLRPSDHPYHPGNCGEFCGVIHVCAAMADHEDLSQTLCGISRCETGDKCRGNLDSPTGRFRGPFQFLPQTWNAQCKPIFAQKHFADCTKKGAIHDTCCATICAAEIVAQGGLANWPSCGKRATAHRGQKRHSGVG